jgi:hypothetical protein
MVIVKEAFIIPGNQRRKLMLATTEPKCRELYTEIQPYIAVHKILSFIAIDDEKLQIQSADNPPTCVFLSEHQLTLSCGCTHTVQHSQLKWITKLDIGRWNYFNLNGGIEDFIENDMKLKITKSYIYKNAPLVQ